MPANACCYIPQPSHCPPACWRHLLPLPLPFVTCRAAFPLAAVCCAADRHLNMRHIWLLAFMDADSAGGVWCAAAVAATWLVTTWPAVWRDGGLGIAPCGHGVGVAADVRAFLNAWRCIPL
ncbi:hypothetical protein NPIL_137421 [Nephila pilipes]|uniref:Uncharacterized protein n=1 Tax=Nephila pilipes TaxID=299642 RepID=A0A8X6PJJ5_NEPPI|nr:hypothetical protein NPIL_137421 [Nephila pilipes]